MVKISRKGKEKASIPGLDGSDESWLFPPRRPVCKRRYYLKLSGEKLFLAGDLLLSLDFKYRYTDYDKKNDLEQGAVRVAFKYKF